MLNGKRENSFRWKIEGRSGENCGIQFIFLVFSSFRTACDYLKLKQQQRLRVRKGWLCSSKKNLAPVLVKNRFGFCKTGSVVGKSATDFGKMSHRLWENGPLTLGSCVLEKKQALFFGKKTSPSLAQSLGKLVRFLDWLGTKLKSHCFERLACLDLDLGIQNCVSRKTSQPVASWKGKMLKPIHFDIETVLGFVLGTFVRWHIHKLICIVPMEGRNNT